MILAELTLGARAWLAVSVCLAAAAMVLLVWSYRRSGTRGWVRGLAGVLKGIGVVALAVCLVEPLWTGTRPRPGSNLFLVVADNSRSLQLSDTGHNQSRGKLMQARLAEESPWLTRLAQDFDVRRYVFDSHFRSVKSFGELTLDGETSTLRSSLTALAERFRGQPVAGILLLTDGNATDLSDVALDARGLPPVYPVPIGSDSGLADVSVTHVAVSQTNFEAAPVTITATLEGRALSDQSVSVRVLDEAGTELERRKIDKLTDAEPSVQRFLLKPDKTGVSFYTVQAFLEGEEVRSPAFRRPDEPSPSEGETTNESQEATLDNNQRLVTVDRGGGPYRVLYVSGRPNWEFKFLRRAIDEDDEVQLVGLVRVAKREPKFNFLSRSGERTNPLFRGFGNKDEQAEQYDEPVLIRLNTQDKDELRGGFPKNSDDLFRFHAVILDDIEAGFFAQDQLSLLQQFVSRRGGGLLMLGGQDSFVEGNYQRTAVGEMLPVYLDRTDQPRAADGGLRLVLTREGWVQSWVRLRTNEQDEAKRLAVMPDFKSLNGVRTIKPGASVLAEVKTSDGNTRPALVVQQFGRGRTGALLVGDLWRWSLRRPDPSENDLDKAWRQTVRWLVSDVLGRVETETRRTMAGSQPAMQIVVRVRDAQFEPLDNASVVLHVQTPDQRKIDVTAESSERAPGQYETTFASRVAGAYRAQVVVIAADGSEVGRREIGWTVEPQTDEFRTLAVNRPLLDRLAQETGGEMITFDQLESFVGSLPNRKIPIVETWTYPLWHQSSVFLLAISCLIGEWGLRRWRGMP